MNMRKHIVFRLTAALLFILQSLNISAQDVRISDIQGNNDIIRIHLISDSILYAGSRPYVLHIGDRDFSLSEQNDDDSGTHLTFLIPARDFDLLTDHSEVVLTYGLATRSSNTTDKKESNLPAWKVGFLDKSLLKR